ncbi:MAG: TIGR00730 family Rossman fold protein [Planctomycetota bacterium]|nr:TIGR00730 family Rossman fold protein [Planctomycetota bacterium]
MLYQLAHQTCQLLGERGFAIITGGGPGIMEACNRRARHAGSPSIGLNIELPHEQHMNPYCDASYTCHYFFGRKMMFAKYARRFLIVPGGFGTFDEFFESLTLIQTGKLAQFPVVLVGTEFWQPLVEWLRTTVLEKGGIDEQDLLRFRVMDSPEEIAEWLDQAIDG